MIRLLTLVVISCSFLSQSLLALQAGDYIPNQVKTITALRSSDIIIIDGILSEPVWKNGNGVSGFTQKDPLEGREPTERTIVYTAYDDHALYIAARMYDSSPDSIIARLARRDVEINSDLFAVFLDPFYDKRSGFYFGLTAGGTIHDGVLYNDNWDDNSWDGIWEGEVKIDNEGWVAEMRIPFSQLRFYNNGSNVWGINFRRDITRKSEIDYLVYVPKNESGFVSHFIDLTGIENIQPPGSIEILPYITTRAEYTNPSFGDPFRKRAEYFPGLGADLKMGIGSNLTLNATVNPDFGQVEIDPAVINLSDVETFFDEKRPFFVEGSTIFEFGQGGANNYWGFNWGSPLFFYSRRIGRSPQGSIQGSPQFSDSPEGTHILGAAKLTGKIGQNWNIGIIQSITQREYARVQTDNIRYEEEIEPLTYYGILRAQKEINEGRQGLGFISTITTRNFKDSRLINQLNKNSYSFGIDGWTFLDSSKTWIIAGWTGISHLNGSNERLIRIQENSQHYFQRPDAVSFSVDSSATSLTGFSGRVVFNKQKGNFFFNSAFGFISPEFDINDLGFFSRSDVINMHVGGGYYWSDPTDFYRYFEVGGAVFRNYDFDGNRVWEGIFNFGYIEFLNYYGVNWNLAYNPETINNRRTRGGPLSINNPGYEVNLSINSNTRKDFIVFLNGFIYKTQFTDQWSISTDFEFRPSSNISFTVGPFFEKNRLDKQWVNSFADPLAAATFGKRYVFANFNQNTTGANIRLNWTFNPHLSLQFYIQPLISAGDYSQFKELKAPHTDNYLIYGEEGSTFNENDYTADPDGSGPANPIKIDNPDFNFKSLRGNAVLRWEYLPGSVLYFVWTQMRADEEDTGQFRFNKSLSRLVNAHPENILMIKLTYWFNM
jgi:hypothetical protein